MRGKGAGQAYIIIIASAIVSYAVYLVAQLLVLYLSRTREYYADAYSGAATRDPHLLASALTKIAYGLSLARPDEEPSGLRAFMIGDPVKAEEDYQELQDRMSRYDLDRDGQLDAYELQKAVEQERTSHWRRANELFGTHPPTYKRILVLEEMEEEVKKGGLPQNIYKFVLVLREWSALLDGGTARRLRNVPALGLADRVFLSVLRHDEDRPEGDHDEDREQDEIHEFREVARGAREDRAVEAARPDDEEAAGQGARDHPVVGGRVHHVEPEGEDHRREAGPPEALVDPEGRGDEQDVGEDRHEDDRRDRPHRQEDRRRQLRHCGPA